MFKAIISIDSFIKYIIFIAALLLIHIRKEKDSMSGILKQFCPIFKPPPFPLSYSPFLNKWQISNLIPILVQPQNHFQQQEPPMPAQPIQILQYCG